MFSFFKYYSVLLLENTAHNEDDNRSTGSHRSELSIKSLPSNLDELMEEEIGSLEGIDRKWSNLQELQEHGIIAEDIENMEFALASDDAHKKFAAVAEESIQMLIADYNSRSSKNNVTADKRTEFELQSSRSRGKGNQKIDMKLIRVKCDKDEFYQILMAPNASSAEMYYHHLFDGIACTDILDLPGVTNETFDANAAEVMKYLAGMCTIRKLSYEQTIGLIASFDRNLKQFEFVVFHPATSISRVICDRQAVYPEDFYKVAIVHPFGHIQDMEYNTFVAHRKSVLSKLRMDLSQGGLDLSHKTFEEM